MKKALIVVLCAVMAFALMACSSSDSKTLEDMLSQDQLNAFAQSLEEQGDGSYTVDLSVDGNSMTWNYYYSEESGVVINDELEAYFTSDEVSAALETACQMAVAQFSANDDFANSGIESVGFSIIYYDSEGTEIASFDYDVPVE